MGVVTVSTRTHGCSHFFCRYKWVWSLCVQEHMGVVTDCAGTLGVVIDSVVAWGLVSVSVRADGGGCCFSQAMWAWALILQVYVGVAKVSAETCGCGYWLQFL